MTRAPSVTRARRPGGASSGRAWAAVVALVITAGAVPGGAVAQDPSPGSPAASAAVVDSLEARGLLQEAAWAARAAGDTARGEAILERLREILMSPPLSARPLGMDDQGVSYTFRVVHGNGVEAIFKVEGSDIFCRECGSDREVAAYRVDRLLGLDLTPMTVRTTIVDETGDTLSGSSMYFVHGAATPRETGAEKPDLLRFFDAVIGNSDRHQGNWLIIPGGRVVAIDHNRGFRYRPSGSKTCWEWEVDAIERPGRLGPALQRFRALPDDSLAAAVDVLPPPLVEEFVAMRTRVLDRLQGRIDSPRRTRPYQSCPPRR